MDYRPDNSERRFWPKVEKTENCWVFTGGKDRGYGVFTLDNRINQNRAIQAHRYAWELAHGRVPEGLYVCHRCDNPPCVRAECNVPGCQHRIYSEECESHLFLGTPKDNTLDAQCKGRFGKAAPRIYRGRPWRNKKSDRPRKQQNRSTRKPTKKHPAKLQPEHIRDMVRLRSWGFSPNIVAMIFGTSPIYINALMRDYRGLLTRALGNRPQPLELILESRTAIRHYLFLKRITIHLLNAEAQRILEHRLL